MPITLSKIANNSAKVSFQYGEDEVTLEYYPGRVTERTFAQLQAFSNIEDFDDVMTGFAMLNELLAGKPLDAEKSLMGEAQPTAILKLWDVLNDDGTMFPIRPDRLSELPIPFRFAVLKAIMGDIRPNEIAPQS